MRDAGKTILVINPMNLTTDEKREFCAADDVDVVGFTDGPDFMYDRADEPLGAAEALRTVVAAERSGYQAVVFTCSADPYVASCREAVRIPVVGVMEATMHVCAMLGRRFAVLVPSLAIKRWQEDNARRYGFEALASVRVVRYATGIVDMFYHARREPSATGLVEPLVEEAIRAIHDDDATVITIGCGCQKRLLATLKAELTARGYDVPVVNPLPVALDVARMFVRTGLTHSLLAYPGKRLDQLPRLAELIAGDR